MQRFGPLVGMSTLLSVAVAADTFDIKPGLWEITRTTAQTMTGKPRPEPDPAMMASLSPEQREKIAAIMKKQFSGEPTVVTKQDCVTPEQIAKFEAFSGKTPPDGQCRKEVLAQTRTELHFKLVCQNQGGGNGNSEFKLHLNSSTSVTMEMNSAGASDGRTNTFSTKAVAKWIGADCGKLHSK